MVKTKHTGWCKSCRGLKLVNEENLCASCRKKTPEWYQDIANTLKNAKK